MPDVLPAPDEAAALRAANARLRQVIETKETEVSELRAQVEALRAQVEALRAEVAELRSRLAQNSKNSSKPPSAEGMAKLTWKSLRKKSGRRPGRPKGQPGATLEMTDHPDEVVWHEPGRCSGCGLGLSGGPVAGTERRQVTDLPRQARHRPYSTPSPARHPDQPGYQERHNKSDKPPIQLLTFKERNEAVAMLGLGDAQNLCSQLWFAK